MGSEQREQVEFETSEEEDESEYPVGYFDDSADSCEEVEVEHDGHLAAPLFSDNLLEQEFELGTGSQPDSYGGVLDPPLGEEFLPQIDFNVGTNSFVERYVDAEENVEFSETAEAEYTAEEWAAWDAGAHDSYVSGGAQFDDESSYYEEESGYYSDDGYY
ncbi:hypothetical protein CYMTET_13077 [Cymbomonas tetramitiformis]|uniref:Uncharacterized protein n=1 Tax=Cymbomonas tetramitiformis TaxID=36881 RepID=A0AAE0LB81_9CHLO|nr:hypothetical protein CYMTET_13077 [Cymbomonas tetramitiformis]